MAHVFQHQQKPVVRITQNLNALRDFPSGPSHGRFMGNFLVYSSMVTVNLHTIVKENSETTGDFTDLKVMISVNLATGNSACSCPNRGYNDVPYLDADQHGGEGVPHVQLQTPERVKQL